MGKEVQPIKQETTAKVKRKKFDKAFKLNAVSLLKTARIGRISLA